MIRPLLGLLATLAVCACASAAPTAEPAAARDVRMTGRITFSAAGNFAAEVADRAPARLVGEPPGGSPHNDGDSTPVQLPTLGWTVYVPHVYVEVLGRNDTRATLRVDVPVETRAADFFAGRDPVLERALALP